MKWVSRVNTAPQKARGSEANVTHFLNLCQWGRTLNFSGAVTVSVEVRTLILE